MKHAALEIFVGEWAVTAELPDDTSAPAVRSVFEWILDGAYLAQRTEVNILGVPDSLAIVAPGPAGYTQHYYNSRGVSRLYTMTFDGRVWTLTRDSADFSPLDFTQRFTGTFTPDHNRIDGAWEKAMPGADWTLDFALTYTRIT
ncbi:hypothetical protein [Asanoa siamensis]|uniref:DUF1579 domain-containing protein n=1 Tax=Asanoa siamensis TaxID=926357 RepID=A0ABQ4D373_9ACTN|nr:hypothetical protein [Asanoa siamensis]GIF77984.1 hypothetical protein Asi02nite_75020 [Asanoa siamensis]